MFPDKRGFSLVLCGFYNLVYGIHLTTEGRHTEFGPPVIFLFKAFYQLPAFRHIIVLPVRFGDRRFRI